MDDDLSYRPNPAYSAQLFSRLSLLPNIKYSIPTVPPHWIHFARAITGAWVGLLCRLWYILVEIDLPFFLRYHGPI